MNVIVTIEGREAIPVRAIPLLTDWQVLSPDAIADALAGDEWFPEFAELQAYRLEDGVVKIRKTTSWQNYTCRELGALHKRLQRTEPNHEEGYQQWRQESLPLLPAGVFVWRDAFEKCFFQKYGPDGEDIYSESDGWVKRNPEIALDYDPDVRVEAVKTLVMEGFEPTTVKDTRLEQPNSASEQLGNTVRPVLTQTEPERRLSALRQLGGEASYLKGKWIFKRINELEARERAEGRSRVSQKTIRGDLTLAAEAEREAKRTGAPRNSPFPT